jgi:hypothetical protein
MKETEYKDLILENRWKVIGSKNIGHRKKIILENIYNHELMDIDKRQFIRVLENKTTISRIRSLRVQRNRPQTTFCNKRRTTYYVNRTRES